MPDELSLTPPEEPGDPIAEFQPVGADGPRADEQQAALIDALGRLPYRSPVRQAAQHLLFTGRSPGLSPFLSGVRLKCPRRWRERLVSAWGLADSASTEEERSAATLALADALQPRRGEGRLSVLGDAVVWTCLYALGWFALYAVFALLDEALGSMIRSVLRPHPGIYGVVNDLYDILDAVAGPLFWTGLATVPAWVWRRRTQRDRASAAVARALGRLGSIESIGPLAEVHFRATGIVREACRDALVEVLRGVEADHYGVLGPSSISALCRTLRSDDAVLVSQVLRAVEMIGTRLAIPELERLIAGNGPMRLRDQAAGVLDVVRAREESELHRERLLRPAGSPTEHLLRPAPNAPAADPDLLLRAAVGDEETALP